MLRDRVHYLIKENSFIGCMQSVDSLCDILSLLLRTLHLEGDVIELGCHRGYTASVLQATLKARKCNKQLHLYDSFQGLPRKLKQDDLYREGADFYEGSMAVGRHEVIEMFERHRLPMPTIHEGFFSQTLPHCLPPKVCFAHFDGDFYSSTWDCLPHVYERLVPGGIMALHDYDVRKLPGVKIACDEFFGDKVETVVPTGRGHGYFIKAAVA